MLTIIVKFAFRVMLFFNIVFNIKGYIHITYHCIKCHQYEVLLDRHATASDYSVYMCICEVELFLSRTSQNLKDEQDLRKFYECFFFFWCAEYYDCPKLRPLDNRVSSAHLKINTHKTWEDVTHGWSSRSVKKNLHMRFIKKSPRWVFTHCIATTNFRKRLPTRCYGDLLLQCELSKIGKATCDNIKCNFGTQTHYAVS